MSQTILRQTLRRVRGLARRSLYRAHDWVRSSHAELASASIGLARLIPETSGFSLADEDLRACRRFMEHSFDLLGSGWTQVGYGMRCDGFEGIRFPAAEGGATSSPVERLTLHNRARARRLRERISPHYVPIDWQLDFKSGYRWSERVWYRDVHFGDVPGADVKVPWELSRLQHLPMLALAFSGSGDLSWQREFQDQVLDWIAQNPPRFGVNWASTMDVGIRAANLALAYDLFSVSGAVFDAPFSCVLCASLHDHAAHIAQNLEWSERKRANHYLGNIAGLLVAAAYLPASERCNAWLIFGIQELLAETQRQFLPDGGHFEASTSYHSLCGEMVAVSAAIIAALPTSRIESALRTSPRLMTHGPRLRPETIVSLHARHASSGRLLSEEFLERVGRAAAMTRSLMRTDGSVPQIGDNDSGRFLRLGGWLGASRSSAVAQQQWLAWAAALSGETHGLSPAHEPLWRNTWILARALVKRPVAGTRITARVPTIPEDADLETIRLRLQRANDAAVPHHVSGSIGLPGTSFENVQLFAFEDFGLYVVRGPRIHLVIRCGRADHDDAGSHAHEDQLSIDCQVDSKPLAIDPGTYIYTAAPHLRNAYRGAHAHAGPAVAGPETQRSTALFEAPRQLLGRCEAFGPRGFIGTADVPGGNVIRTLRFHADSIQIRDEYWLLPGWRPASIDACAPAAPLPYSPAYGVREAT
jgi:hypothetical protein